MRYDFLYRYGDIFALNLNDKTNFVFVCDLDTMEDIGKQDNFSFRQDPWKEDFGAIFEWMRGGINVPAGVIGSSGKTWKEQRRFALRQLKGTFGFGFGFKSHKIIGSSLNLGKVENMERAKKVSS